MYNAACMSKAAALLVILLISASSAFGQSRHKKPYSESVSRYDLATPKENDPAVADTEEEKDVLRIETDLVAIPVKVTTKNGQAVPDIRRDEFRVFENGEEQEIVTLIRRTHRFRSHCFWT